MPEARLASTSTNREDKSRMQLADDIRNDIKEARKFRLPGWAIVCGIVASTLSAWLFDYFGRLDLDLPTWNCLFVFGFIIVLKRTRARFAWFWVTMTIFSALHVALIVFVPWTTKWVPAVAIGGVDTVDFVAMLAILSIVERLVNRANGCDNHAE